MKEKNLEVKNAEDVVDQYVHEQMDAQHIPGLSLAVVQGGAVVKAHGYGLASLELGVAATTDTVYQIGSITKQFTAVAIMMLAQEGKIALDKSIACYQEGLPENWGGVTVRQLLNHTSGIPSFTNHPNIGMMHLSPTTREGILDLVVGEPLEFTPGDRHTYNNTGYYLLGHIIERISGQSYGDFLRERIFTPLAMESTRLNDMKEILPGRACGYEWVEDRWKNADHISMTWPFSAGALVSTVSDLARWDLSLGSEALLTKARWEQMWTPTVLTDGTTADYGFGWGVGKCQTHRVIGHGGGIPGFITFAERYPDDGLAVVVLTNLAPSDPAKIARGVAGYYDLDLSPTSLA